jgi:hypothetical protein
MLECERTVVPYIEVYEELLADSDFNMDENNCDNSDGVSEVITVRII